MFPDMNKCENGWSNFSASFRIVAQKLTELIQSELPNLDFLQYSLSDIIMSNHLLCIELASTSTQFVFVFG